MERSEEWDGIDFESYPKSENYWMKRGSAYIVDTLLALVFTILFILLLGLTGILSSFFAWIVILLITGILTLIMKSLMESITGSSIGQKMFKLRVVSGFGSMTMGDALKRNGLDFFPLLIPIIDLLLGSGGEDRRQKLMDRVANALVVEELVQAEEVRRHYYRPPPVEPKERTRLGFPDKLRVGKCPRCGAPYRILDQDDKSFSGLWNYRCTWCNQLVFDAYDKKRDRWK